MWDDVFDLVVMVSDGMEIVSTGGWRCDLVDAMVELVRDGVLVFMDFEW